MPLFRYQLGAGSGRPSNGQIQARDADHAAQLLQAQGFEVQRLERVEPADNLSSRPLSTGEVTQLAEYLSDLTSTEMPLPNGLRALAAELPRGPLTKVLGALASQLEQGQPLPAALEALGSVIPKGLRSLIQAGLQTGQLGEVLQTVAQQQRQSAELWHQCRQSLAYPLLVVGLLIPTTAAFHFFLQPVLNDALADVNIDIFTYAASANIDISSSNFGLIALVALALGLAISSLWLAPRWKVFHQLRACLPLLGPLFVWCGFAEFTKLLATLLRYGVSLPEAIRQAAESCSDTYLGSLFVPVAARVEAGEAFSAAISKAAMFPPTLGAITTWGIAQDRLPDSLLIASEYYHQRAWLQAKLLEKILPPLLFLLSAALILSLMHTVLFPMVQFISLFS